MCGIAGAFTTNKVAAGRVEAATRCIAHRGPDDSGIEHIRFAGGETVLGNCRLAILDLSPAGHMPMSDPATGNWITNNGEIYNYRELKQELVAAGETFRSDSDTEVILKGYTRHGQQWFARLRGMFALALFDAAQNALVLARDRFGIKPLYYTEKDETLYFASEVRALLRGGMAAPELDPIGLQQFLAFGSVYEPHTILRDVKALPAGHVLTLRSAGCELAPYCSLADAFRAKCDDDVATASRRVSDLVCDSIQQHIVSDVPVSLFLSGGIDSSVLALGLQRLGVPALNSFSVVFDEADYNEAEQAKKMAAIAGTDHHEVHLRAAEVLQQIPAMLRALDQPSFDGINSFVVSQAVRSAGYKVALSGLGGDEVFGGYSTFQSLPQMERWQAKAKRGWPVWLPAALAAKSADQKKKVAAALRPPYLSPYAVLRGMFMPETIAKLSARAVAGTDGQAMMGVADAERAAAGLDAWNRVSYLELTNYMRNTLLRDADAMSMAHSLEVRVPFVDHELIGYVAGLPGAIKSGRPKSLLISAFADALPEEIINGPKRGFTLPFEHWLRGELKPAVEQALTSRRDGPLSGWLNGAAVASVWGEFTRGGTSWTRPWSLYVLQQWCEHNL